MIKIFQPTDRDFSSNGDVVVLPIRAVVHEEDNGSYYITLESGLNYLNYLVDGNLIVAGTPKGQQAFRISGIEKTKYKIKIKAKHVFYDAVNYLIEDSYVVNKSCLDALDHLNNATEPQSEFNVISDVSTVNTYRCVRASLFEAVKTVHERWGGHLTRDNFTIGLYNEIGADNGVTIRYAKNMQDITCTSDWTQVATRVLPVGKDGITLNALDPSASVYVESDQQYAIPYTKTVTFAQDDIVRDNYDDDITYQQALIEDLRQQAQSYVDEHCYPTVNYSVKANIDRITGVGDVVEVIDERLGISLLTNVISYDYDCVLGRYTAVELGNFQRSISGFANTVATQTRRIASEQAEAVRVTLSTELEQATSAIWSTLGNSYVVYDGDKILVLDSLPKESAQHVMMINAGGIGFSSTGIHGTFNSAWTIDGTLNMQNINVIGTLSANLIKGGTLKLGSQANEAGIFELYDEQNNLIGLMDSTGLKMYGQDGSYVLMNQQVGFAGYDRNDMPIYWVNGEEFHMRKSVIEEEITLCGKMRFIPITISSGDTMVNDGIGLVSVLS